MRAMIALSMLVPLLGSAPLDAVAGTVITSGQFVETEASGDWLLSFGYDGVTYTVGDEFAIAGEGTLGGHQIGQVVSGTAFDGLDMGGTYTAGGVTTNVLYGTELAGYNSELGLGSTVNITGSGTFFGTFGLSGSLCAYAVGTQLPLSAPPVPCLNTGGAPLQLTGSGTVEVTATSLPNYPGSVDVTSATYTFVPEPGSLGLLILGLGLLAVPRRSEPRAPPGASLPAPRRTDLLAQVIERRATTHRARRSAVDLYWR